MKVIIGSDHAGYEYKSDLISFLKKEGVDYEDCGCYSADSVDYPDYAHDVLSLIHI